MITGAEAEAKKWLKVKTETSEIALEVSRSSLEDLVKAASLIGGEIIGMEYAEHIPQDSKTYAVDVAGGCGKDCLQCDCKKASYKRSAGENDDHA